MAEMIQKATDWDKQSAAFRKKFTLADLQQTHIAQPKYDGCHLLVDTSAQRAFSRENTTVLSCDHIIQDALDVFGPGWVVPGEAWHPAKEFKEISGMYRRHKPEPTLEFVAYDCLPSKNFYAGFDPTPYVDRLETLYMALHEQARHFPCFDYTRWYNPGTYIADQLAQQYKAQGGYDGIILRNPHAPWRAGICREGELVKVKPTLSLDLLVVDVLQGVGEKTGRNVYTIDVVYKGVVTRVGSGVPHNVDDVPTVGAIVEVEAMGLHPSGALREPRFKAIRHDKKTPD